MRYLMAIMLALCCLMLQASAGDYVLHIFGNANMDGTIDEKDIDSSKGDNKRNNQFYNAL